jgi:hypothetical protein
MMLKAQRQQVEREEENRNRRIQQAKFAEDDRREKEASVRRAQKMMEFKQEVSNLAAYKKGQYEVQKQRELDEARTAQDEDEHRQAIIESERQRMLREHAESLMAFLPKGVLRKADDLDMLVAMLNEKMNGLGTTNGRERQ